MQFKKNIKKKYTVDCLFHGENVLNELLVEKDVNAIEHAMESVDFAFAFDCEEEHIKDYLNWLFKEVVLIKTFFDEVQARGLIHEV